MRFDPATIRPDRRLVHWYLVFTVAHREHWWDRFIRPGFNHCYAFQESGDGWLLVNPRADYLEIAHEAGAVHNGRHCFPVSAGADNDKITVIRVLAEVPKRQLRSRWFVGPVTCVEIVKGLLGIRAFYVFTPWQLYNYVRECRGHIRQAKSAATISL